MRKQNDEFKASLSNIRELPNYLERINQNIINIEKKIQKENKIALNKSTSRRNIKENLTEANEIQNIIKTSVDGINQVLTERKKKQINIEIPNQPKIYQRPIKNKINSRYQEVKTAPNEIVKVKDKSKSPHKTYQFKPKVKKDNKKIFIPKNEISKSTHIKSGGNINTNSNIYNKSFPQDAKASDIMKLMLFFNEYLINTNLIKDNFSIDDISIMNSYSSFLSKTIRSISISKKENKKEEISIKEKKVIKIQRKWREHKISKIAKSKSNIKTELKNMLITNFIENEGFIALKLIGLMNTSIDTFISLKSKEELTSQLIDINLCSLSSESKHELYKKFITYTLTIKKENYL